MSDQNMNIEARCSLCGCTKEEAKVLWTGPSVMTMLAPHIVNELLPVLEKNGMYSRATGMYSDILSVNVCCICADSVAALLSGNFDGDDDNSSLDGATDIIKQSLPGWPVPPDASNVPSEPEDGLFKKQDILSPESLCAILSQSVVGQDAAKRKLSLVVYEHYKRIMFSSSTAHKRVQYADISIMKSNVLMLGPTGSGKTYMLDILARHLSVPFVTFDASRFTRPGYVGANASDCVERLLQAAKGDVALAQRGIIYLDELDKLAEKDSTIGGVNGASAQSSLLTMLEGADVYVNYGGERRLVNTKNILFVAGGAFVGINDIAAKRTSRASIGFTAQLSSGAKQVPYSLVNVDDLRTFGMIPELLGRFPSLVTLEELGVVELQHILNNTKNSLLDQYKKSASFDGVNLIFNDGAVRAIAERALLNKTGARGLRTVLEDATANIRFSLPGMKKRNPGLMWVVITEAVIRAGAEPEYRYHARQHLVQGEAHLKSE